jgi:hypothetical protein
MYQEEGFGPETGIMIGLTTNAQTAMLRCVPDGSAYLFYQM